MGVASPARSRDVTVPPAFDAFYRRERPALYRALSLTLGDRDLAVEAVDEALTRAYQRWPSVSRYDNAAGWVYRVALNWATSVLRRRRPLQHVSDGTLEPELPDPELARAVAQLPVDQRTVVVLRFSLDWSLDQIAAALELPLGTVKSRLHRALATLRQALGDHDGY